MESSPTESETLELTPREQQLAKLDAERDALVDRIEPFGLFVLIQKPKASATIEIVEHLDSPHAPEAQVAIVRKAGPGIWNARVREYDSLEHKPGDYVIVDWGAAMPATSEWARLDLYLIPDTGIFCRVR